MRKIIIYFIIGGLIFTLTQCKGFLEVNPQGTITEEEASKPDNVEGLVIAAYAWVPHESADERISKWIIDIRSDDAYKGGGGLADGARYEFANFSPLTPDFWELDLFWFNSYEGISRTNAALRALNNIDESEFEMKDQRIAEMRFLRGIMYLQLKRIFKWIPYFKEDATDEDIKEIPNHPDSAKNDLYIWKHIYDDFAAAADVLPETQEDLGRPTKYAAEAEMANVLMWMAYEEDEDNQVININKNRLSQALDLVDDIINSGKYSLSDDYGHNFLMDYDNKTPETIWSWQFTYDDGTTDAPPGRAGNRNGAIALNAPSWPPYFSCCDFHKATYDMVNAFRVDDDGLPLFDTFNNTSADDNYNNYFSNNSFDPRLGHTVAIPGLPWKYQKNLLFDSSASRSPSVYGYFNSMKEQVKSTNSSLKDLTWMHNAKNVIEMRYSRILLWKAEILIQLGRENEALPLINEVRKRASNSTDMLKFANGDPTLNYHVGTYKPGVNCTWNHDFAWKALQWEDRLEFGMEATRWYDIVRWGIAADVMNNYIEKELPRHRSWLKDSHFTPGRDEYLPIPQNQMNLSRGVYKQNPGYN